MIRISKNLGRIIKIEKGAYEIDGFLIIPGITQFLSITILDNRLSFNSEVFGETITVYFSNASELERFLVVFSRDNKIDQILDKK